MDHESYHILRPQVQAYAESIFKAANPVSAEESKPEIAPVIKETMFKILGQEVALQEIFRGHAAEGFAVVQYLERNGKRMPLIIAGGDDQQKAIEEATEYLRSQIPVSIRQRFWNLEKLLISLKFFGG